MNRKSLKQPASTQDRTDQPTGLMNATGCRFARSGEGHPVYEPFTLQTTIADRIVGIRRIGGMMHVILDEA
jgi:hypothetical protein